MDAPQDTAPSGGYHITIVGMLWLMALLAASLAAFGAAVGLVATAAVLLCAFVSIRCRRFTCLELLIVCFIVGGLLTMAFSAAQEARSVARHSLSGSHLKQLAIALINYDEFHESLPHAGDGGSEPQHSWRTALLPFLEEQLLYGRIDHDLPWDSLENRELFESYPLDFLSSPRFRDGLDPRDGETHYFAVVGEETLWPPGGGATLNDIPDGAPNTILLVEALVREVPWYKPKDLSVEQAIDLLCGEGEYATWIDPGFFYSTRYRGNQLGGVLAAFADGRVRMVPTLSNRDVALALLTPNGREEIDVQAGLDGASGPHKSRQVLGYLLHWHKIIPTAIFVMMASLPWFPPARRRLFWASPGAEAGAG